MAEVIIWGLTVVQTLGTAKYNHSRITKKKKTEKFNNTVGTIHMMHIKSNVLNL